ncbi:SEL1-like repeat protein [Pedobacter nototheniae]|uniref:SEL1-like repeat protein n=1 Tax=Pedobacter nototheniae TaxID=2488994 RepID=UPI00292DCF8B|nr:WG repeat-containing protein [Pedobacter nototheniae]
MSHRVYLYNAEEISEASKKDRMMMEWGYEIPLFLMPLLIDGATIAGNNYNTHTPGSNSGLFYLAPAGVKNLKRFYNFIEKHQDELIDDVERFATAKANIFEYIDDLKQPYFNLDAWDVFNMNSESHQEQAEEWLADIKKNNDVINFAIEADEVSLLKLSLFTKDVGLGYNDFKSLFNASGYDYGWEVFYPLEPAEPEIFEENKLWGLKNEDGKILVSPKYEEFYAFNDDGFAVVMLGAKFGYVNKAGKEITPLCFDDAFDFEGDYATVVKAGKFGLIDKKGNVVIDFIYQDMEIIDFSEGYTTAKLNDKWGIVDPQNKTLLAFEYENTIERNYHGFYFTAVTGKKSKLIFSNKFAFLTECEEHFVEMMYVPDGFIYAITKNKKTDEHLLFSDEGKLLLSGYEKIINNLYYVFVIRKDKKYGLLDYKGNTILGFEYNRIDQLPINMDQEVRDFCAGIFPEMERLQEAFFKLKKDGKYSFYLSINNFNKQVTDFIYDDIVVLSDGLLSVQNNGLWGIMHVLGNLKTPIEYDLIATTSKIYCCKGDMVYTFKSNRIVEVDKARLQDDIDINKEYGYCYFNGEVANRLQAFLDKDLPLDEVFYKKAIDARELDTKVGMAEAVNYFKQATDLGNAEAMNDLARIYEDPEGKYPEYKDDAQAFQLFLKSAQLGCDTAMLNTAFCYSDGMGTPIDYQQMVHWHKQAFDAGNMQSAIHLGHYYYDGEHEEQDTQLALKYYLKADEIDQNVNAELGWLYNELDMPNKALPYLLKSIDGDETPGYANWQLGFYAEYGEQMKVNLPLAIKYYKKAEEFNRADAFESLYLIYARNPEFKDKALANEYKQKAISAGLEIEEETFLGKLFKGFKGKNE